MIQITSRGLTGPFTIAAQKAFYTLRPYTCLYFCLEADFFYLEMTAGGVIREQCVRSAPWIHFSRNISTQAVCH